MNIKHEPGFSYFWIGIGLGAIGGFLSALLALRESREYLRNEGAKSLQCLSAGGKKLRERAEGLAQKGGELISQRWCQCGTTVRNTTANGNEDKIAEP